MEPLTAADPSSVREFRVLARLGAGGMGRVYLATSPAGRLIAIKVIQPRFADDAEFIRRFRGEADAARRVSGLYTAPVVAARVDDSPPWLATAFVPGPSLLEVVAKYGPLPPAALWRLAAGLAEALRAIHSVGLVHRDLKPANVLLAFDGPRVIDFGISRATAASTRMTATGAAIGTPSYMSPEQVEGIEAGPASDVFSFGSVVAFAATGSSPFASGPGASTPSIMFRIVHGEPALDGVPGDIREIAAACLAKVPAQRPDLGQVAARSATAVEHLGLSPTAFWPESVANVVDAEVAALSAELQALQVPVRQFPATQSAALPPPAPPPPAPPPAAPPAARGAATAYPGARGAPSRRAVLIGASVAGAAAIAGAGAWAASALSGGKSVGPGSLAWRFTASHQPNSPAAAGDLVYFGTGHLGNSGDPFYAVSVTSGRQAWSQTPGMVTAAPTVAGGIVCMVDSAGTFYAAHATTGARAWTVATGNRVVAGERIWDASSTLVALAPGDGSVSLFHTATGKEIWKTTSPSASWRYVALFGTRAVYAFDPSSGILSALSVSSGHQLWNLQVPASSGSDTGLSVGNGGVYFGNQDSWVYCVDVASRRLRWRYSVPGASFPASDLVIAGGLVYFSDGSGVLHAITAAHGKQEWTYPAGIPSPLPAVAYANGHVYVSTGSALQQLRAASGAPGWSFTPESGTQFTTAAAVGGGLVFAGCDNSAMYAVRA